MWEKVSCRLSRWCGVDSALGWSGLVGALTKSVSVSRISGLVVSFSIALPRRLTKIAMLIP